MGMTKPMQLVAAIFLLVTAFFVATYRADGSSMDVNKKGCRHTQCDRRDLAFLEVR